MRKTYHMKASELDQTFVEELKATFEGKQIEIVISEAPNYVCLYDFEAIESEGAPIDPKDIHIDDGSVESFLRSGKKTLRGPNGEKPVGKIIQIETNEALDERWQDLFDEDDREPLSESLPSSPELPPAVALPARTVAKKSRNKNTRENSKIQNI